MASAMVKQIERQEGSQVFQGLALDPVLGGVWGSGPYGSGFWLGSRCRTAEKP